MTVMKLEYVITYVGEQWLCAGRVVVQEIMLDKYLDDFMLTDMSGKTIRNYRAVRRVLMDTCYDYSEMKLVDI